MVHASRRPLLGSRRRRNPQPSAGYSLPAARCLLPTAHCRRSLVAPRRWGEYFWVCQERGQVICTKLLTIIQQKSVDFLIGLFLFLQQVLIYSNAVLVEVICLFLHSWRALRIQKSVNGEGLKSQSDKAVSSSASSVSDSKEECKRDISSSDSLEEDDDEDDDDIDLAELGRALSEAASLASQSKKQNHGRKLTAKTSSPVCADRVIDKKLPVVPCFYIYAEEEKLPKKDASVCSKNISSPIKDHESDPDTKEETWEVEDYEYDRALNADRVYLKFKKRVDAYPEQCFRYSYGGRPLLASEDAGNPGMCRLCGAARQYEMQLMPPLLYFLQEAVSEKEKHALDNWNWMTLIVYTCSQNCSNDNTSDDGWTVAEEVVVVQYE